MKKILLSILFAMLALSVVSCTETTTTATTKATTTRDTSWKVQYDPALTSPDFRDNVGTCYQIFTIAWADSNGDGYGDFKGIEDNLDYLANDLNVDCIWMTPFNASPSYHKYDVTDYYAVDPQFGTIADLESLLSKAHDRGIRVLMDFVINHTSANHPWFVNATIGPASSYRNFYVWNDLSDRQAFPSRDAWYRSGDMYYFASFWSQMPELNYDNPAVRAEIKAIASYWLDKGIDGFRIDAAKHIYDPAEYPIGTPTLRENVDWFEEFNAHVKSVDPDAIVLGEVFVLSGSFVANYYAGMDSAFDFDFADKLMQSAMSNYDAGALSNLIATRAAIQAKRSDGIDSLFLTNHDQDRIADRLGHNVDKLKLVNRVLMTLPGIAWIYYGEELGMSGVKPDGQIRQPFIWDGTRTAYVTQAKPNGISAWTTINQTLPGVEAQKADPDSLLSSYMAVTALRRDHIVLRLGDLQAVDNSNNRLMAYTLTYDGVTYLVIHNFASQDTLTTHDLSGHTLVWQSAPVLDEAGVLTIPAYQSVVFQINQSAVTMRQPV
jgi:glycosidase